MLQGGSNGCNRQRLLRSSNDQATAVVEYNRDVHGTVNGLALFIAQGKGHEGQGQEHRETTDTHQAETDPPTGQEAGHGEGHKEEAHGANQRTGLEEQRIYNHGGGELRAVDSTNFSVRVGFASMGQKPA